MLKDEYERGYDWFHQGESLLLFYFLCMAAPERWPERALRFAELYVDPAHGNYDPEHRIIRRPHNGSDPERGGLVRRRVLPVAAQGSRDVRLPAELDPAPRAPEPAAGGGPAPGRGDARGAWAVGDTAVNLAATGLVSQCPDPVRRGALPRLDRRVRRRLARARRAANGGILPDNVAPDGTVGGLLEGRWYGGHYGWSWPHGWYSVGHAAAVAALAAATATGDDSYLDLVRPALDEIIAHGKMMAFSRGRLQPAVQVDRAAARGRATRPPCTCPSGTATAAGSTTTRCCWRCRPRCGTTPPPTPTASASSGCATAAGIRLAHRAPVPQQGGGGHEEPWFAFLAGDDPGLPRADPRRRAGPGAPPSGPDGALPRTWTCPRPTSTCGSSRIRWSPRPWSSSPGAGRR